MIFIKILRSWPPRPSPTCSEWCAGAAVPACKSLLAQCSGHLQAKQSLVIWNTHLINMGHWHHRNWQTLQNRPLSALHASYQHISAFSFKQWYFLIQVCVLKINFFLPYFLVCSCKEQSHQSLSFSLPQRWLFLQSVNLKCAHSCRGPGKTPHAQALQVLTGAGPCQETLRATSRCHTALSREFVLVNCLFGGFGHFFKDFGSLVRILALPFGSSVTEQVS